MNTNDFLMMSTAICPDRPVVIFEGKRLAFAEMNERANRLANALAGLGFKKGDPAAIVQVNCPQYVETYYAITKLGGIFVPMNFRAKKEELEYLLNHSEANTIFVGERYIDLIESLRPSVPGLKNFISIDKAQEGTLFYEDLMASGSPDEVFTDIEDDDVSVLLYTAGTTGRPKGVPLTHNGFATYMLGNVEPPDPEISEVNLLTVPLYHVAGIQSMLAAIYGGRSLAMMRQFEVDEWLETVQKERANRAMLVPTMLKRVIDHPDFGKYDLSCMKVITYGAASMPFEVIKKAIKVWPDVRFINAFGQTETASTITALGPEDHVIEGTDEEKELKLKRLSSSIGKAMSDVEMTILDDAGKELPLGEVGEIVARGPRIMSGYWKDAERTSQTIDAEGWLHTNDMGWRDDEGYFYLSGRGDDMIIRGGENISPEEVEDVLHSHPKVDEAAVIGVDDPEWGQVPRAVVVLKAAAEATAEDIMEHCRANLASFKRPRSVVFIDAIPKNPVGKVLRKTLREQYGQP